MGLDVDPPTLAAIAGRLANAVDDVVGGIPKGWAPTPSEDPVSRATLDRINRRLESVLNTGVIAGTNEIHPTAYHVGASAVEYGEASNYIAQLAGKTGGDEVTNPVPWPKQVAPVVYSTDPAIGMPTGTVDPLTFAQALEDANTTYTTEYATSLRNFRTGAYNVSEDGVQLAVTELSKWTPVGTQVSERLTAFNTWQKTIGNDLKEIATGIDNYVSAFNTVKSNHPTVAEIKAARQEFLKAQRAKPPNPTRVATALAKLQEINTDSVAKIGTFTESIIDAVPANPAAPAKPPEVVNKVSQILGTESPESATDTGGKSLVDQLKEFANGGETATNGTGTAQQGATDSSAMNQMLPMMMQQMMQGMQGMGQDMGGLGEEEDLGLGEEFSPLNVGASSGGGGGGGGIPDFGEVDAATTAATASMGGIAATTSAQQAMLPRTPVIEGMASTAGAGARAGGMGAGGMPMMPFMPGAGGAGQGAGGDRNRVVAWHPDRLMYVDDTPHTELVIGERPSIAPTVTPPTPAQGGNASQTAGGSA